MSQVPQVKVTLKDLGDVVLLDKGMSASSLVSMLRQRRNQQHESWRPISDSSSGTYSTKTPPLKSYRRVVSSNTSCLEPHPGFYRLLMKGISFLYCDLFAKS